MVAPRTANEREENETEKGLRVVDKGFMNTAVMRSEITFIDGEAGGTSSLGQTMYGHRYTFVIVQFCDTGASSSLFDLQLRVVC